jgi:single-stranded-DNA-specific exonuclease
LELPLSWVTSSLYEALLLLAPFGFGNYEPVFAAREVKIRNARLIGAEGKHLKCTVQQGQAVFDAIGFGFGQRLALVDEKKPIDIAFTIDKNVWNGREKLQLKLKDIQIP